MQAPERGLRQLEVAQPIALELGSAFWISKTSTFMALALVQLGRVPAARAALQAAGAALHLPANWTARPAHNTQEHYRAWAWGEMALANGQPAEALRLAS